MRYDECLDRLQIIQILEMKFQSKVITFYRNRNNEDGIITEDAYDDFQSTLDRIGDTDPLFVIIDSVGGNTLSGWKIASCINERIGSVCTVVPEEALSAATLIALAGNRIIMHPKALLSPVDPQLFHQGHWVSALDLLESTDPVIRRKGRRAIDQSSENIRSLCKGKIKDNEKIEKVVERLLLQDRVHASHSSFIKAGEARTLGFRAKIETYLDVRALHSLYRRHHFCEHDPSVIIEYSRSSIPSSDTEEKGNEPSEEDVAWRRVKLSEVL
jgi:ATP-dependent protease ClpP protease subunit